jgi:putative tryptophan/tyrosine transport system substrate-binding protein
MYVRNARRILLLLLGLAACMPSPSAAQSGVPRVAFLSNNMHTDSPELREAFRAGLRQAGYVEGKSILIEWRFAERNAERLAALAREIVALKPSVIVAETTPAVRAAQQATQTIPIVMTAVADAVGSGLVRSLARPGANVTGMSFLGTELVAKRLELLKQAFPQLTTVNVLQHAGAHGEATSARMREETEQAARATGLKISIVQVRAPADLRRVFETMSAENAQAVLVWPSPMFLAERVQLSQLASKHRLPAIYYLREYAHAGGLIVYGPSLADLFRRSAAHVDKILKGAKAGDLPVEQPSRFELIINLAAARELGIKIPESVLVRADDVIGR